MLENQPRVSGPKKTPRSTWSFILSAGVFKYSGECIGSKKKQPNLSNKLEVWDESIINFNLSLMYNKSAADDFIAILVKHVGNNYKYKYTYGMKLKTLWQKEKLLIMSKFSFCYNVFKSGLWLWERVENMLALKFSFPCMS